MFIKHFKWQWLSACIFILSANCAVAENLIRINVVEDPKADYMASVIKLAIDHIDKKYRIERQDKEALSQTRAVEEINAGNLDVTWTASSDEVEHNMQPIRIPVFKGLIGHRILIIRQGDQARFDNIQTLEDLKSVNLGQGTTWADTKILEANGLHVTKTIKYPNLFYMLDGGRFDAFPRGVSEPYDELPRYPNLKLAVEKNLLLIYRMPFYLFVKNGNNVLAKDLETGLNLAIADGSFEKLFLANKTVQDVIEKTNIANRRVIHLENPTLSKETPLDRAELWIDPKTLGK
jgi:hypothetical protein